MRIAYNREPFLTSMSPVGPSVWTGRALQAESDDLEVMGLALLYPALDGTFEFLAIMDIRARSISFASRPRRPYGPPDHERAGETFSPSPHSDSQTSAGKPTLTLESARAVPSEPPSLAREIWRATGATGGGGHPFGESEHVHFRRLPL